MRAGSRRTPEPPSRAGSQHRDVGACCVRARPRPFLSPAPPPSPGLPRPRRTAGLVTRERPPPPPRSISFFSPQPATACALPPASSSRSAGQLQPDKGTRGTRASLTPERAAGARGRRSGSRRRGSCERPHPGGRHAVPGVSCHRVRGAAASGIVSLARPAGCQGLGVGAHRPGGTPGDLGRPPASAARC